MKMDNPWCKSFFLFHGIRETVRISCHVYDHLYIVYYMYWIQLFLYDILSVPICIEKSGLHFMISWGLDDK